MVETDENQQNFAKFMQHSSSNNNNLSTLTLFPQTARGPFEKVENNIQLSPEGEVNGGGYILRREASRYIYPPLFTDPEADSCFSIYQIR